MNFKSFPKTDICVYLSRRDLEEKILNVSIFNILKPWKTINSLDLVFQPLKREMVFIRRSVPRLDLLFSSISYDIFANMNVSDIIMTGYVLL